MQRNLFCLVLAAGFLFAGCDRAPQVNAPATLPKIHDLLLPAKTAHEFVHVFDSICFKKFGDTPIRAYTIRSLDLLTAMGLPESFDTTLVQHKFIRVYLGYDLANKPHAGFKLFIVPVDGAYLGGNDPSKWAAGTDVYLNGDGKSIGVSTLAQTPNVVDLNAPCPNTCSVNNELNK